MANVNENLDMFFFHNSFASGLKSLSSNLFVRILLVIIGLVSSLAFQSCIRGFPTFCPGRKTYLPDAIWYLSRRDGSFILIRCDAYVFFPPGAIELVWRDYGFFRVSEQRRPSRCYLESQIRLFEEQPCALRV